MLTFYTLYKDGVDGKTTSPNNNIKYWEGICEEPVFVPYSPGSCRHYNYRERRECMRRIVTGKLHRHPPSPAPSPKTKSPDCQIASNDQPCYTHSIMIHAHALILNASEHLSYHSPGIMSTFACQFIGMRNEHDAE